MDDLRKLAGKVNNLHEQHGLAIRTSLEQAKEIGELLLEIKHKVPKGMWLDWMKANLIFDFGTGQRYMRIATEWDFFMDIQEKQQKQLSYRQARETHHRTYRKSSKKNGTGAILIERHDPIAAYREAADGDLIEMLVDILASRSNAEAILQRVMETLRLKSKKARTG